MWRNDRTRVVVINVIIFILIVAIAAGLFMAWRHVREITEEHDAMLSELYVQQQQEQSEARQESVTAIQAEYENDMQTVADYLPGIVCWGDSITLGSAGNISYPYVLQKYIDTYITDIYDFRSTIENAEDYSRLKWDSYKVSIPVVNMGAGPESTSTVLGRCGAVPYVTAESVTIPAGTEPTPIRIISQNGRIVTPLTGGNAGVNEVTVNGIRGNLALDIDNYRITGSASYTFTRSEAGAETTVPAGTVVATSGTDAYKDYIHVVCIGTYGDYTNAEDLVRQTQELVARQTKNSDRYIVLGLCSSNGSKIYVGNLDSVDTAMMQAFGNKYINLRKYFCGDGLADAGIAKTSADISAISMNAVPDSFFTSSSSVELNGKAQKLIGRIIFNRMESLGYFDEVYSELGITETVKQIIKDNPSYFENIIRNTIK